VYNIKMSNRKHIGLIGLKYGFSVSFHCEQTFFDKTECYALWVLSQDSIFFKTCKDLCTPPKHLTDIKYEPHGVEIQILGQFSS
jgi:hypothetical protein